MDGAVTIIVAAIGAWGLVASARRTKRTEEKTDQVSAKTDQVAAQLQPNGGKSMRDAIDRLDRRATGHDERLDRIDAKLDRIIEQHER